MTQKLESAMTERDASYGLRYLQEASKAVDRVDSLARQKADAIELHQRGFMSASAKASVVAGIERQQVEAEVQKESRTRVLHDYVEGLAKDYGADVYVDFQRMGDSVGGDFGTQFANEMAFLSMTIEGEEQHRSIEERGSELATDPNFNAELFREFMDPESADHQSLMYEWVGYGREENPGSTFEDFARATATSDVKEVVLIQGWSACWMEFGYDAQLQTFTARLTEQSRDDRPPYVAKELGKSFQEFLTAESIVQAFILDFQGDGQERLDNMKTAVVEVQALQDAQQQQSHDQGMSL